MKVKSVDCIRFSKTITQRLTTEILFFTGLAQKVYKVGEKRKNVLFQLIQALSEHSETGSAISGRRPLQYPVESCKKKIDHRISFFFSELLRNVGNSELNQKNVLSEKIGWCVASCAEG